MDRYPLNLGPTGNTEVKALTDPSTTTRTKFGVSRHMVVNHTIEKKNVLQAGLSYCISQNLKGKEHKQTEGPKRKFEACWVSAQFNLLSIRRDCKRIVMRWLDYTSPFFNDIHFLQLGGALFVDVIWIPGVVQTVE